MLIQLVKLLFTSLISPFLAVGSMDYGEGKDGQLETAHS